MTLSPYINNYDTIIPADNAVELGPGRIAISGGSNIHILDIKSSDVKTIVQLYNEDPVTKMFVINNGMFVTFSSGTGTVRVWDPNNENVLLVKPTKYVDVEPIPSTNKLVGVTEKLKLSIISYSDKFAKETRIVSLILSIMKAYYVAMKPTNTHVLILVKKKNSSEYELLKFSFKLSLTIIRRLAFDQVDGNLGILGNNFLVLSSDEDNKTFNQYVFDDQLGDASSRHVNSFYHKKIESFSIFNNMFASTYGSNYFSITDETKQIGTFENRTIAQIACKVPYEDTVNERSKKIILTQHYLIQLCLTERSLLTKMRVWMLHPVVTKRTAITEPNYTYPSCAAKFKDVHQRLAIMQQQLVKICDKNSKNIDSCNRAASLLEGNNTILDQIGVLNVDTSVKNAFDVLHEFWMVNPKIFKKNIYNIDIEGSTSIGIGVRRSFFDDAIRKVPTYLETNGAFSWLPQMMDTRSSSSSGLVPVKNSTRYRLLSCFPRTKRKVAPKVAKSAPPNVYTFIGQLLAFGLKNQIKLRTHLSCNILQSILKTNVLDLEYVYYGMEESPNTKPYVFYLLKGPTDDNIDNFNAACDAFDIDRDFNSETFEQQLTSKLRDTFLEQFNLINNANVNELVKGFNTVLPKNSLRKFGVSELDASLSANEMDEKDLEHFADKIIYISSYDGINTKYTKHLIRLLVTNSSDAFYTYVKKLPDDSSMYLKEIYNTPNGHATFITNLLKFWTGVSEFVENTDYCINFENPNDNTRNIKAATCFSTLLVYLYVNKDDTDSKINIDIGL